MNRTLLATVLTLTLTTMATAGPLPWTYTAKFSPTSGSAGIFLGFTFEGTDMYHHTLRLPSMVSESLAMDSYQEPFSFSLADVATGPGWARSPISWQEFQYTMELQNELGQTGTVSVLGSISVDGTQTSGTGNITIGFGGTEDVMVGSQLARVTFGTRESESATRLTFDVELIQPAVNSVPEPATVVLVGVAGLAWVVGRRRQC
jgi:hypothetical protein